MGKIITSPTYVIDIAGTDALFLGESNGGGGHSEKLEKMRYFNFRRSDRILMKFYFWKDVAS